MDIVIRWRSLGARATAGKHKIAVVLPVQAIFNAANESVEFERKRDLEPSYICCPSKSWRSFRRICPAKLIGRKGRADFEEDCEEHRKCLPRHAARTGDALRMLRSSLRLRSRATRLLVFEGGTK